MKDQCPNVPMILLGSKLDLRSSKESSDNSKSSEYITYQKASLNKYIKAVKYLQCPSVTFDGLKTFFEEAIAAVLKPRSMHKRSMPSVVL